MTSAKHILLIIAVQWILSIDAGVFSPKSKSDLRNSVWGCMTGKSNTGSRDPRLAGVDIYIQYCGGWGYGPKSRDLKKKLEQAFDGQISVREVKDSGTTGNFEVFVNGENIWSKQNGQGFPKTQENVETIINAIKIKVDPPTTTMIKTTIPDLDIHIQYCGGWGYGPRSKELKKQLEDAFDGQVSVRETRDSGETGNFEVFVNGEKVWSKKDGQGFPGTREKVEEIKYAIAAIRLRKTPDDYIVTTSIAKSLDIYIQYCGGWGYDKHSSRLKSQLEEAFDGQISVREVRDPGVTGNFEVYVNGDRVWSKRTWGQEFPESKAEIETICDEIRDRRDARV